MRLFFGLILCLLLHLATAQPETCSAADQQCSGNTSTNKYSKEPNTYARLIDESLAAYTPCNHTKSPCDCYTHVIADDLRPFAGGITIDQVRAVAARGTRYQIIDHRIYRQPDCMFPSRCSGVEHFLRANLQHLPNLEVVINCRDWPQVKTSYDGRLTGPVFSFSKTAEYADIQYPVWAFWEGGPAISLYPRGLGRWDQHRESISRAANETWPWQRKDDRAFFRGSRTSGERDVLVRLSRAEPQLVDAQYTKNQAWKSSADTLGAEPAAEVSLQEHCAYKYLFNFRGVAASFRFKHLFLCRSLVFHVGDEWQEFFYPALRPWVHYVPVRADHTADELRALIEFFRQNDGLAREIAERGFELIWRHLDLRLVECYWRRLLRRYAKLLRFEVVRDEELIEI